MTWLDRILATECPNCKRVGQPCFGAVEPPGWKPTDVVCASRIAAAEGVAGEHCQCGDFDNCDDCLNYVQSTGRRP